MDTDTLAARARNNVVLLAAGLVLLAGIGGAVAAETHLVDTQTITYEASGTIVAATNDTNRTRVGVAAGPNMTFGEVPLNANITRFVRVSTAEKARVAITADGNISQFLTTNTPAYFQGERELRVTFRPRNSSAGTYTGTVTVLVDLPTGEWGRQWLDITSRFS